MVSCHEVRGGRSLRGVKLLLENLPPSLAPQRETLARCIEAMNRALPLSQVILFGSHARGDARPDSDADLCLVAEGAEQQPKQRNSSAARFDRWWASRRSHLSRSRRRDWRRKRPSTITLSEPC